MTYRFPWDEGVVDGLRTRLIEDGDNYGFEFHDPNNDAHARHRLQARTSDTRGYTESRDMRLVAHLSPAEQLKLFQDTGVMPGVAHPQDVIDVLNRRDYSLFRTIEDKIGRAVKD